MHIPQSMLWGSYPRHLRISTSIVITPLSIVWFTYMQTCIHVKVFASEYLHIHFSMDVTYVNFLLIAQTFKTFHYSSFFLHTLVVSPFFTKGHLFLEHFPCHNINDCWTFPFFFCHQNWSIIVLKYMENKSPNYSTSLFSIRLT